MGERAGSRRLHVPGLRGDGAPFSPRCRPGVLAAGTEPGVGSCGGEPAGAPWTPALVEIIDRIRATLIAVSDCQPSLYG